MKSLYFTPIVHKRLSFYSHRDILPLFGLIVLINNATVINTWQILVILPLKLFTYLPAYLPLAQNEVCSPGVRRSGHETQGEGRRWSGGGTKRRAKLRVTEQQEHTYFRLGVGR